MTQVVTAGHSENARLVGALGVLAAALVWSSGGLLIRADPSPTTHHWDRCPAAPNPTSCAP